MYEVFNCTSGEVVYRTEYRYEAALQADWRGAGFDFERVDD